jgi:NADH:ubiquinone oxidoreductase subunit 6 (subunit J)
MMFVDVLLTVLTVAFALLTVFSKKTVISAFALLMTLVCIGGIYYQLGSVFLSAIQLVR